MSWDIILLNSKQKVDSIEDIDDDELEPFDFSSTFESEFENISKDGNHREITGADFSIEYFTTKETASNQMVSLYGENGLYALIELAKKYGWLIYDTGMGEVIDLEKPENNGYENHQKYIQQILKK